MIGSLAVYSQPSFGTRLRVSPDTRADPESAGHSSRLRRASQRSLRERTLTEQTTRSRSCRQHRSGFSSGLLSLRAALASRAMSAPPANYKAGMGRGFGKQGFDMEGRAGMGVAPPSYSVYATQLHGDGCAARSSRTAAALARRRILKPNGRVLGGAATTARGAGADAAAAAGATSAARALRPSPETCGRATGCARTRPAAT